MSYTHLTKLAHQIKQAYYESPTDFMNRPEELSKINKGLEAYAKKRGTTLANLQGAAFNEALQSVQAGSMKRRSQEIDTLNKPENIKRLNTELERIAKSKGTTLANLQGAEFDSALKSARSNTLSGIKQAYYEMPVTLRAREATDDVLEEYAKRHGTTVAKLLGSDSNDSRSDSNDSNSAQAQVKKLEAQLKEERNRRRTLGLGLGIGLPTTIAASVLFDRYRNKKYS